MTPTPDILAAAGLLVTYGYPMPGDGKLFVRYPRAPHWRQKLCWHQLTTEMWSRMQAVGVVAGFLEAASIGRPKLKQPELEAFVAWDGPGYQL